VSFDKLVKTLLDFQVCCLTALCMHALA
jgi:hypothetical protein